MNELICFTLKTIYKLLATALVDTLATASLLLGLRAAARLTAVSSLLFSSSRCSAHCLHHSWPGQGVNIEQVVHHTETVIVGRGQGEGGHDTTAFRRSWTWMEQLQIIGQALAPVCKIS